MTDPKRAWDEVGDRANGLALKLQEHFRQAAGAASEDVSGALDRLTTAVGDAFEALGSAAKDDAVRDDVREVGDALVAALSTSFAQVSESLRSRREGEPPAAP